MKYMFYSISDKKKIEAEVTEKVDASTDKRKSYILKGITPEGKKLTAMVSKKIFDEMIVK